MNRTIVRAVEERDAVKTERIIALALLCFVIVFSIGDVFEDLQEGSNPAHVTSEGLIEAIDAQLEDWGLSSAEKEITFLIMKGLSFKEIADIRKTSEHTVRQQAATVYRKSGLDGRSQLTAFF